MRSPSRMPQSYPSPTAAQVASGAGPFYSQAASNEPPSLPHDLHQLQDAGLTRSASSHMDQGVHNVQSYSPQGQPHHADLQAQHHADLLDQSSDRMAQERLAQGVLSMSADPTQQGNHVHHAPPVMSYGEETPDSASRKRSKVSRACDECRRKKIRCDARAEVPDEPCENCKRTRATCQFSRQPLKRGPSKGYIKELADRLNRLENDMSQGHLHPHHLSAGEAQYLQGLGDDGLGQRIPEAAEYSPPPGSGTRKRTHSMSEGQFSRDQDPYASSSQRTQPTWGSDTNRPLSMASQVQAASSGAADFSSLRAPASPPSTIPTWRSINGQRDAVGVPFDTGIDESDTVALVEWDESVVDEYYRLIHQTFPLLPHTKTRLRTRLGNVSSSLREAFLLTLELLIRTSPSTVLQGLADAQRHTRRAAELISASQFASASTCSLSTDIIYIQTLVLMALASDNIGPATMKGQVGPPRAEWLGRAIGMATHLKLNMARSRDRLGEGDPDADEKLGRRVWWVLFILDRWHSSSTNSLLQLPDNSSSLVAEDQILLGEATYHLARLSFILGHLSAILQQPAEMMSPSNRAAPIITLAILGEIDRFRESVESQLMGPPNLVHLSYWHVRLLVLRLTSSTAPHELLAPATRMASILNSMHTTITPLNHHFAALAAMTLVELCEFDETRAPAERAIRDIVEALGMRRGLMSREDSTGWDSAIRELVQRKRTESRTGAVGEEATLTSPSTAGTGQGLQHLANAAMRPPDRDIAPTTARWDASSMTRTGYLAALVAADFGGASIAADNLGSGGPSGAATGDGAGLTAAEVPGSATGSASTMSAAASAAAAAVAAT